MIGEKDSKGNTLRLGGRNVSVWERPEGVFILKFPSRKEAFVAKAEKDAVDWYNKVEGKELFKLPDLPERLDSKKEDEGESLVLPDEAKLLGKFESQSTPGMFHYVIRYKDSTTRCTCWPFTLNRKCNHYNFVKSALETVSVYKLIEKPIIVRYNREEVNNDD